MQLRPRPFRTADAPVSEASPEDPLSFWHEHLGRHLSPDAAPVMGLRCNCCGTTAFPAVKTPKTTLCVRCRPLHLSYPYRGKDGKASMRRLDKPACALVKASGSVLVGDYAFPDADQGAFEHRRSNDARMDGRPRTVSQWIAALLADPPSEPYLFIEFCKRPSAAAHSLRFSTPDVLFVAGPEPMAIRRATAIAAADALDGVPPNDVGAFAAARRDRERGGTDAPRLDERLVDLRRRRPALAAAEALIPAFESPEYVGMRRLIAARAAQTKDARA